jgi:hypothetical protein
MGRDGIGGERLKEIREYRGKKQRRRESERGRRGKDDEFRSQVRFEEPIHTKYAKPSFQGLSGEAPQKLVGYFPLDTLAIVLAVEVELGRIT